MSLHAIFGQGANVRGGTCPSPVLKNTVDSEHNMMLNIFIRCVENDFSKSQKETILL